MAMNKGQELPCPVLPRSRHEPRPRDDGSRGPCSTCSASATIRTPTESKCRPTGAMSSAASSPARAWSRPSSFPRPASRLPPRCERIRILRRHLLRRRQHQQGRLPRGPQLRLYPSLAGHLLRPEQRLCDYGIDHQGDGRRARRRPRPGLQHAERGRRWDGLHCRLADRGSPPSIRPAVVGARSSSRPSATVSGHTPPTTTIAAIDSKAGFRRVVEEGPGEDLP